MHESPRRSSLSPIAGSWRMVVGYGTLLLFAVGMFLVIRHLGEQATATATAGNSRTATVATAVLQAKPEALPRVLIALLAILATGRLLGGIFQKCGQPRVLGEVVAGILLGPSALGRIWPAAMTSILPPQIAPYLGLLAQIGIILYMFLVGLDLNSDLLRKRVHASVAISHASIVVPLLLGAGLALWLHERYAPTNVPLTSFALFLGSRWPSPRFQYWRES